MFEKSLVDLVKGIRSHRDSEAQYISKCVAECKTELKSNDPELKAQAVQKLIYLHMLGHDMSWAAFHVVEVMSQSWFAHKRIGYLAASQSFHQNTDVILLTTHLFRKGFSLGQSLTESTTEGLQYEVGAAINCLANICTPDLAMDLLSDIYGMMNSSRPYIRKKAVLVLLKIFRCWPKALRLSFDRLKAKLTDDDAGVTSAAMYVVCELARKNPKNYLALAPTFFKILTTSTNNWVLIKVVKLMGNLVPLEPRLAKKLANPLSDIIESTPAKSLLYECVNTLLCGEITSNAIIRLCLSKLTAFIEDHDQNLKYLGLLGLHRLMKQHPRAVEEHRDLVLDCLTDEDVTIRMRALDIISSMVSKRNLKGVIQKLIEHLDTVEGSYREHVLERIIHICSQEKYAYISDFEWYISTLVDLAHVTGAGKKNANLIKEQLIDATVRVEAVRPYAVRCMETLLGDSAVSSDKDAMSEVLYAAGWIVGEYAEFVATPVEAMQHLLSPHISSLSQAVQNVFLHNTLKIFAGAVQRPYASDDVISVDSSSQATIPLTQWKQELEIILDSAKRLLPHFSRSDSVEVQERAVAYLFFIARVGEELLKAADPRPLALQIGAIFSEKLNVVNPKAQKKVPVPQGLDLDKWINDPPSDSEEEAEDDKEKTEAPEYFYGGRASVSGESEKKLSAEELARQAEARAQAKARREQDPYYIKDVSASSKSKDGDAVLNVDDIPIKEADFELPHLKVENTRVAKGGKGKDRRSSSFTDDADYDERKAGSYVVSHAEDVPEGVSLHSDEEEEEADEADKLETVDLSTPLRSDEVIPRIQSYDQSSQEKPKGKEKSKKSGKKKAEKKTEHKKEAKKEHKKEKGKGKEKGDRAKKEHNDEAKGSATANILGIFDPLADPSSFAGTTPSRSPEKEHKETESPSEAESKGAATTVDAAVFSAIHALRQAVIIDHPSLKVTWSVTSAAAHSKSVTALLLLEAASKLQDVELSVKALDGQLSVKSPAQPMRLGKLAKGSKTVVSVKLGVEKEAHAIVTPLQAAVSVEAAFSSKKQGQASASATAGIPCSAFVVPSKLSMDELTEVLSRTTDEGKKRSCQALKSSRLTLKRHTMSEALKLITKIVNVKLIEAVSFTATYYGKTIQGHHVAVLVKANKEQVHQSYPVISVDIKSSTQSLSDALMAELQTVLQ